jgi:ATP-dependent DNA helicase DinG
MQEIKRSFRLIENFPYANPRPVQREILEALETNWNNYDVFVLVLPTASGKTALAKSIMRAHHSVSVITPTNLLVQQFIGEFPDTPTLSRLDSYTCAEWKRPCSVTRARLGNFCKGCKCGGDLAQARYKRGPGVYNYYTYMAHKLYRKVLVVDEAHTLLSVIKDRLALKMWQHDYRYPSNAYRYEQIKEGVDSVHASGKRKKDKKLKKLREAVTYKVPEYIAERTHDEFNGKGTVRGQPEMRDLIKLTPVDITEAPPMFWPQEVEKIVLMSGTISKKDIEQLGLSRKRILYIEGKSPISVDNRPIVVEPIVSVNHANTINAVPQLAEYIKEIAAHYEGQKGIVHATYQLAYLLRKHLTGPKYIFHDRDNKSERYAAFRSALPSSGVVLIASGMYEGIDLPEDLGRWQIIAKVPWQSLGNPAIKHLAELDPEWFNWETIRTLVQAAGRICRTPDDFGATFIPDRTFLRLIKEAKSQFPKYFLDALQFADESSDI